MKKRDLYNLGLSKGPLMNAAVAAIAAASSAGMKPHAARRMVGAVMAAQRDLVHILARCTPRLVKMAPAGERPED